MDTRADHRLDRRRFTLIELLMVTAIIALLFAMILPALNQARAKAKQANCVSKMKQITLAVAYYIEQYEGYYPLDSRSGAQPMWTQNIKRSLGDISGPGNVIPFMADPGIPGDEILTSAGDSNYMFNAWLNARNGGTAALKAVRLKRPARTLQVICGHVANGVRVGEAGDVDDIVFPHPPRKSNILYGDSHVDVVLASGIPNDDTDEFWDPREP